MVDKPKAYFVLEKKKTETVNICYVITVRLENLLALPWVQLPIKPPIWHVIAERLRATDSSSGV